MGFSAEVRGFGIGGARSRRLRWRWEVVGLGIMAGLWDLGSGGRRFGRGRVVVIVFQGGSIVIGNSTQYFNQPSHCPPSPQSPYHPPPQATPPNPRPYPPPRPSPSFAPPQPHLAHHHSYDHPDSPTPHPGTRSRHPRRGRRWRWQRRGGGLRGWCVGDLGDLVDLGFVVVAAGRLGSSRVGWRGWWLCLIR